MLELLCDPALQQRCLACINRSEVIIKIVSVSAGHLHSNEQTTMLRIRQLQEGQNLPITIK